MPGTDAGPPGEARLPRWRERLNRWLAASRGDGHVSGAWVAEVLDAQAPPLSLAALATAKDVYLSQLRSRLATVHCYGLDERRRDLQQAGQRLSAAALYRPLNTTARAPTPGEEQDSADGARASAPSRPEARVQTLLEATGAVQRAIVRGAHGTGKSTFIRYLAFALARGGPEAEDAATHLASGWQHGGLFPIWVDLRAFGATPHDDGTAVGLCAYIAHSVGLELEQLCWQVIAPGGVLLLLDGLEHAPDAAAAFLGGLDAMGAAVAAPLPNVVIVTTQPYIAHEWLAGGEFGRYAEVDLAPWEQDDLDGYARTWYAELLRRGWVSEEAARDLPGQLRSNLRRDEVRALARRPALMAAVAQLHMLDGRLPADRGAFYHRLIDLALSVWAEGRDEDDVDLSHAFDLDGVRSVVAALVHHGYARTAQPSAPVGLAESELRAALLPVARDGRWETVNELVRRVLARPCLLEELQPGVHAFVDLDLQAHVVARHLLGEPSLPDLVAARAEHDFSRWRPVIMALISHLVHQAQGRSTAIDVALTLIRPSQPGEGARDPGVTAWRMARLSGEALAYLAAETRLPGAEGTVAQVRDRLVTILEREHLAPGERAQVGSALDRLPDGDVRSGVQAPEGLWCEVPEGAFWSGEGGAAGLIELDAFWMARYPVTNAQYLAFVEATGHAPPRYWHGSVPPTGVGNHPVVDVTWRDAADYCAWWNAHALHQKQHLWRSERVTTIALPPPSWRVRLPKGEEWEKAARGGVLVPDLDVGGVQIDNPFPHRLYPWGNTWRLSSGDRRGDETRCNVSESGIGATTPVGMYPSGASPYGVMGLAGDVWEWGLDWADGECRYKARRGGAFRYTHDQARCSASDRALPGLAWPYAGFRLVLGLPVGEASGERL